VRNKNASPVANDYLGMKQLRSVNRSGTAASATPSMMGDRYEKRQGHQPANGLEDLNDSKEINPDETRSLVAELDYSKKDATRHIVTSTGTSGDKLRQKLLRNLEGVRKNKPILKSEASVARSIRSRQSNISARQSQALSPRNALVDAAGRLSKIDE